MIRTWIDAVLPGVPQQYGVLNSAPRTLARTSDEGAWHRW
jgi:hypothetical protein